MFKLFGTIAKIEDQPDGTIKVYGVASSGTRDTAGEIVAPDAMKSALPDYSHFPALREMHQPIAAGRVIEADVDGTGITNIVAHVVDPVAVNKVKLEVYKGFSIGGKVTSRDPADRSIITGLRLVEISLVDSPCNTDAVLTMWKADLMTDFKPASADVVARAKELAKGAGTKRFTDFLFDAQQELVAEHVLEKGEIAEPVTEATAAFVEAPAAETPTVEVVAEEPKAAAAAADDKPPVDPGQAGAAMAELIATGGESVVLAAEPKEAAATAGDPGDEDKPVDGEEEGKEAAAAVDPAEALSAALDGALEKAKEPEAVEATADETPAPVDYAKEAAALSTIQLKVADGATEPFGIQKSLYSVSRFARILDQLAGLQSCISWEEQSEGDSSSGVPAALKDAITALGAQLVAYAQEEVAEIVSSLGENEGVEVVYVGDDYCEYAAEIVDLVKGNVELMEKAKRSKSDAAHVQSAHDSLAKLGAVCDKANCADAEMAASSEAITKLESEKGVLTEENDRLNKALTDALPKVEELSSTVAELKKRFEEEPLPPKTAGPAALKAVEKGTDSAGGVGAGSADLAERLTDEQVQKAMEVLTPEQRGDILLRASLRNPMPLLPR